VIAVLLFAASASAQIACNDTISSSTNLTENLADCPGTGLTIGAENITLDCAGHSITGDGSPGDGINNAGYDNVTVKNCIISGFNNVSSSNYNAGIHYYNEANNGSIINNTANSNLEGIFLNSSSGNNITDNIANDNVYQGILLIGSNNNTITNNIAINSTTGIYLGSTSGCSYNTITYNNISNSSQNGISLDTDSNDNIIENNKVSYSSNAGIGLWSSSSNNIRLNQIYNNTNYDAFQGGGCSNNNFTLNYWGGLLCNAKTSGITSTNDLAPYYMDEAMTALQNASFCCGETVTADYTLPADLSCSGTGLTIGAENITFDCAGHSITGPGSGIGVKSSGHSGVTIENCEVSGFAQGILSSNGNSNHIINNTVHDNSQYGIGIRLATSYTIAENNVSYSGVGIRISASSGSDVYGNTVTNTTGPIGHGIDMVATSSGNTIRDNTLETNNVSISSADSHDNVIHNNTIISPNSNGIYLYNTGYSNVTDNYISNALINGIFVEASTGPLSHNLVQGNTISLSVTDVAPLSKSGIRIEDDNNEIYNNTIDCTSINSDYSNRGIFIYGSDTNAENNVLSGNEISNCQEGLGAWYVDYFEASDEDYHNNTHGSYFWDSGTNSTPPLIANSRIYDNSHGVYLTMGSYANISNTNFTNNPGGEGGPGSGIHVSGGSTAYVTNGRLIDNGEYGIYDIVLNDHVYWTINGNTLCRNNDAKINGSITFDGGKLELDNCTLFLNGVEININGNITSLDQTQAEVEANTTSGELNFTASNASITLNLAENVTVTVIVLPVTPNASGTTASLTALKGIEITVDNATRGNLTWALIKIFYNESELTAANITESTLKIYYYNTTATAWQLEPNQGVDTINNYVWANVTHFSMFGAFGSALIAALAPSGGGGGSVYQLANTSTFQMFSGDTVRFAAGSQNHSALLLHVYSSYVTMRISSDSFDVNLSANAIQKVDANNDSIYDLAMTLKNMTGTKATIQFEKISEPVPAVAPPTPPPAAPPAAPPTGAVITPEVNITAPAVLPTNITAPTVPPAATPIILPRALIIELLFIAAIAAALLVAVRSTHRKYKAHRGHTHPWYRGQGAVPAKLIM